MFWFDNWVPTALPAAPQYIALVSLSRVARSFGHGECPRLRAAYSKLGRPEHVNHLLIGQVSTGKVALGDFSVLNKLDFHFDSRAHRARRRKLHLCVRYDENSMEPDRYAAICVRTCCEATMAPGQLAPIVPAT